MMKDRLQHRIGGSFTSTISGRVKSDMWIYLSIAAYSLLGSIFLLHHDLFSWGSLKIYAQNWFFMFVVLMPCVALLTDAFWVIHRFDKRRRLAFRYLFAGQRLALLVAGSTCLMALSIFQSVFTSVKTAFPIIQGGFPYERVHAEIDKLIHFNTDPWRIVQPVLGFDEARMLLEWNYNFIWFVICFGFLFFVMTSPKAAHLRSRYVACFMLVWIILGTVLAGAFLSSGPAFYGFVTGDTQRFADQLAFLAQSGDSRHSAASYQHYLWTVYATKSLGFGSGISAFPSMHVSLIVLTALFLTELTRKLATPLALYIGLVMVSSVYLGWHYAIDGYVSLLVTLAIYVAVNRVARWREERKKEASRTAPAEACAAAA